MAGLDHTHTNTPRDPRRRFRHTNRGQKHKSSSISQTGAPISGQQPRSGLRGGRADSWIDLLLRAPGAEAPNAPKTFRKTTNMSDILDKLRHSCHTLRLLRTHVPPAKTRDGCVGANSNGHPKHVDRGGLTKEKPRSTERGSSRCLVRSTVAPGSELNEHRCHWRPICRKGTRIGSCLLRPPHAPTPTPHRARWKRARAPNAAF